MPAAVLHFFHFDDPNGSTIFECDTDDQFVKSIELDIQRDSLGGGKVNFARKVPAGGLFQRDIIVPETLVRVLIPSVHPTKYLHGFFINPRQQQVVSKAEQGGKGFTFAGPGPKHYLTRRVLFSQSFSGRNSLVDRDAGIWEFSENAAAGQIWAWLVEEDQDQPAGPFLPDLTVSFGTMLDSNGVPWVDDIATAGEPYVLRMQDDYLKILWLLEDASTSLVTQFDLGEVGAPLLELGAYQTYGRDLTGPIGADTVHFTEGVNIASDLDVEGSSYRKASHALVRGNDGNWQTAVKPGWSGATDLKKLIGIRYDSANGATLIRMGERYLRRQDFGEQQIDLRIVPGFDPESGLYMPGPEGTDGQFWVGDSVDLTTGMGAGTALDYQSEAQGVTGIELELEEAVRDDTDEMAARSFKVTVHLNEERKSGRTSVDLAGSRGTVQSQPSLIKLCKALEPGEESFNRLYLTDTGATMRTASAGWTGGTGDMFAFAMTLTATSTTSAAVSDWSGVNAAAAYYGLLQGTITLSNAALLEAVQTGGTFRIQNLTSIRHGIGINEGAHREYLDACIRVYRPGTSSYVGTLFDVGTNTGTVYANTDLSGTPGNRSMVGTYSAVAGALSTDQLVVEWGLKHDAPTTGGAGGGVHWNDAAASDLPEDDSTLDDLNSWVELRTVTASTGSGLNPDLVGTSSRAARCDHAHHVMRDRIPVATDDTTAGYPEGTVWYYADDEDDPTEILGTYLLLDNTADAAVWVLQSSAGVSTLAGLSDVLIGSPAEDDTLRFDGTQWVNDARQWEVVTNGVDTLVWEGSSLVFEWNS